MWLGAMFLTGALAAIVGLLLLARWRERVRDEVISRQVAVTDAIHRELGPIVAPRVKQRLWGPWEIIVAVPFEHRDMIGTMFALAYRVPSLSNRDGFRFVLTPLCERMGNSTATCPRSAHTALRDQGIRPVYDFTPFEHSARALQVKAEKTISQTSCSWGERLSRQGASDGNPSVPSGRHNAS